MTQLDASLVERGIACTPGAVPTFTGAIAAVEKIRFFVGQVPSRLKVHVTVGHQTVMGDIQFFGMPEAAGPPSDEASSILGRMEELTAKVSVALVCTQLNVLISTFTLHIYMTEVDNSTKRNVSCHAYASTRAASLIKINSPFAIHRFSRLLYMLPYTAQKRLLHGTSKCMAACYRHTAAGDAGSHEKTNRLLAIQCPLMLLVPFRPSNNSTTLTITCSQ